MSYVNRTLEDIVAAAVADLAVVVEDIVARVEVNVHSHAKEDSTQHSQVDSESVQVRSFRSARAFSLLDL
jgi:hypothetical protein